MGDEVDFLPTDNTKVFYKFILSIWVCLPGMPKVPKATSLQIFVISQGKPDWWSWSFAYR